MSIADSAVGAILEIPPEALADIQKAQRYIDNLQITSKRAADAVKSHWGEIATSGLDSFIQKLSDAQQMMKNVSGGKIDFNINTQPLENKLNDVSNATKKTANDVSSTVQTLAWENIDFSNMERLKLYFDTFPEQFKSIKATIASMERTRLEMTTEDPESQKLANKIQLLREYYDLSKKSEEQLKTKTTVFDQGVLNDQKTLLQQIIKYQKDINAESLRQERVTKLGGTIPQEDIDRLQRYKNELDRLTESYNKLKSKIDEMSTAGQSKFNAEDVKHTLAMSREQTAADEKRGQALQMVSKYLSDIKLKSAGISSREEGTYMNEQVGVYRQMIDLIKKRGEVESQVASQGYAQTSAQTNLLQTIQNEYTRLEASLTNVTGKYAEIDRAVKSAFDNTKIMQEAENAAKLADAYQKAAEAADKKKKADAKSEQTDLSKDRAEYKRVLTLIEQIEKAWRKVTEALANTTLPTNLAQQLKSSQAAAEATLDNLFNRRAELESKRGQELADIYQQNEAKKGAAAVAEHEKAEKEKTRISKQEATDRYTEEMRQARLQNQSLTAQGKQQRMTINDAKEQRATELAEQRRKEIERLRQEIGKLNEKDADYQKNLDRLNQRINELLGTTQRRVSYTREEATAMAKSASTLREYENAYKALKDAMANTNPNTKEWQEMNALQQKMKQNIDEIKKKMDEFQSQSSKTSGVLSQLQGRIAAAFSIGAINGFIKKMVEVRAQFELQRVALGAIIQDRDEANKIFTQVQNMALESPFNIMQLEKATKQIAAFGFETQKLVPTMKMFADISAGLGVEIDRLVLVMGHLKARNFLEGTMVRQFTNMGFNVLGELSKYYSELENKMVSVGEVQDRVKKKMVSFEDVEEVLKRVTSAGGMFYDMQKKQSESLWGQLQRIQDAYDLMLNSIGQSNEGVLKSALSAIRSLINHWRILAPIVSTVGGMMATAMAVKAVQFMISGIKQLNVVLAATAVRLKLIADAQKFAQMTTAIGAAITVLATLALAIKGVIDEQNALNESLERVRSEGVNNMYGLIFQYRQLADTVKDTNATYDERKKALDEIKRIYKDILPDQMLEIENIKKMKDGYDEATQAIQAYYAEKIKTQQKEAIDESFGKDMTSEITDISNTMADVLTKNRNLVGDASKTAIQAAIRNVLNVVTEEIKSGQTEADKLHERFLELLASTLGVSAEDMSKLKTEIKNTQGQVIGFTKVNLDNYLRPLDGIFQKIEEKYGEISAVGLAGITLASEQERKDAKDAVDRYAALEKAVDAYKKALQNLREEKEKGNVKGNLKWNEEDGWFAEGTDKLGQSALDTFNKAWSDVWDRMESFDGDFTTIIGDVNNALQSNVDMSIYFDKVNEQTFGNVLNNWKNWGKELTGNNFFVNFVERMNDKLRELTLTDEQKQIRNLIKEVGKLNNVDLSKYKWALIDSKDNVSSVAKEVKSEVESLKKSIEKYQTAVAAGLPAIIAQAFFLGGKTLEEVQQTMKAVDELSHKLGNADKASKGGKSDKELKRWQDLKKAIEDVRTAYEKARKSFTVEESNKQIEELFGATFKELGSDIHTFYKNGKYDAESLTDALEVLLGMTKATTEERKKFRSEIQRKIADVDVEINVKTKEDAEKQLKQHLDEMFANYELTEELKKIGVSVDLTYMVGGKPTTLADIRREIARLRAEGGGKADAENRIKILEEAEKKMTQIELKEQKERLKNYEKYLKQAYSDSAKVQLEYFVKLQQMQEDFAKAEKDLNKQLSDPETSTEDKFKIQKALEDLPNQAGRAARGMREEMEKELDKLNLDKLLKSPLFSEMFQDLGSMTNSVLDKMLDKIKTIQKSANDLSLSQIRQLAQYAEKIENAKLDNSPFKEAYNAIKKAYELRAKGITAKSASDSLAVSEEELERLETLKNDISLILGIKEQSYKIDGDMVTVGATQYQLTAQQKTLLSKNTSELNTQLDVLEDQSGTLDGSIKKQKQVVTVNAQNVQTFKNALTATEKLSNALKKAAEAGKEAINAVTAGMQLFGKEVSDADQEWLDFVGNMMDAGIELAIMFVALGATISNALGIIGIISTALTFVAGLFKAIFQSHDKRLEKEISKVQDRVDALSKSFEKLQKSIERAFTIGDENRLTEQALDNLEAQKQAYLEMIRLEEAKKKTDDDKVKDYKEKIADLAEAEEELYEKKHEKWGSTNSVWDEANNWVDAWLDAYKETGDGLDALNESWDEFYENLVKKQAASKVLGARMDGWIKQINDAIDKNMGSEYDYIDLFKSIGERMKADFDATNEDLKKIFEYAGIGGGGSLILSDLQKGIQNITEPQAAAIEAYLNSMRFAVFRHTEQLDTLIATIQMQYGSGTENPVVTELKGIRGVLDSINSKFDSIIGKNGFQSAIRIVS